MKFCSYLRSFSSSVFCCFSLLFLNATSRKAGFNLSILIFCLSTPIAIVKYFSCQHNILTDWIDISVHSHKDRGSYVGVLVFLVGLCACVCVCLRARACLSVICIIMSLSRMISHLAHWQIGSLPRGWLSRLGVLYILIEDDNLSLVYSPK